MFSQKSDKHKRLDGIVALSFWFFFYKSSGQHYELYPLVYDEVGSEFNIFEHGYKVRDLFTSMNNSVSYYTERWYFVEVTLKLYIILNIPHDPSTSILYNKVLLTK